MTPGEKVSGLGESSHVWEPLLKGRKVSFVIAYAGTMDHFQAIQANCSGAAPYLVLLHLDGHSAAYGVRETPLPQAANRYLAFVGDALRRERGIVLPPLGPPPQDQGRFQGQEFDAWTLAFGRAEQLPRGKPQRPQPLPWWTRVAVGPGPQTPETGDAASYLAYFHDTAFRWHYEHGLRPQAAFLFSALTAASAVRTGNALADTVGFMGQAYPILVRPAPSVRVRADEFGPIIIGPSSPVLLAIRAARRVLLRNPEDADAYYQLGRAYWVLARETAEGQAGGRGSPLTSLREVQAIGALRNAVLINPDHAAAHFELSLHYPRAHFDDLVLKHFGEFLRIRRRR